MDGWVYDGSCDGGKGEYMVGLKMNDKVDICWVL